MSRPGLGSRLKIFAYDEDLVYSEGASLSDSVGSSYRIVRNGSNAHSQGPVLRPSWLNPIGIYSADANYAQTFLDDSVTLGTSQELHLTGFDFSAIPDDSTIVGITVSIRRWNEEGYGTAEIHDVAVQLYSDIAAMGNPKTAGLATTAITPSTHDYGENGDLWGLGAGDWTKGHLVNGTGLGVGLTVQRIGVGAAEGRVDHISVAIDYTTP